MKSIFEIIQRMNEKFLSYEGYQRALVEKYWEEIVGSVAKRHSRPRQIRDSILYVSVDSSVWNQTLFMEKRKVIENINRHFPRKIVADLKFQMGNESDFSQISEINRERGDIVAFAKRKNETDLLILKALQQKEELYQKNKHQEKKE